MKHLVSLVLVVLVAIVPATASYSCYGPVTGVSLTNTGVVMMSGFNVSGPGLPGSGLQYVYLCQIGATAPNSVSSDTCKALYSRLLVAEVTGQQLRIWFYDDNMTCSTHPSDQFLTTLDYGPGTL